MLRKLLHPLEAPARDIALLIAAAFTLYVAGGAAVAAIAGYSSVFDAILRFRWEWYVAALAGVIVAFLGYRLAYLGITRLGDERVLSSKEEWAVVTTGFGSFLSRGGAAVDEYALERARVEPREAKVRVYALQALEHVPLAILGCTAAVALLLTGRTTHPGLDFLVPWAVLPPLGTLAAVWIVARYRDPWRDRAGRRGKVALVLDAIYDVWRLARERTVHWLPFLGITLFWVGDIFALWSTMEALDFRRAPGAVVIAYFVGYALTRRSAPLGGAGFIEVTLSLTLWDAGVPLATAVAAVLLYRVLNLWLPLPFALASLKTVRSIDERRPDAVSPERTGWNRVKTFMSPHRGHTPHQVAVFTGVSAILAGAGILGAALIAGLPKTAQTLVRPTWIWFAVAVAGLAASYVGYLLAYREVARAEGEERIALPRAGALVATGFGLFIPGGGFSVDVAELQRRRVPVRDARVRVLGLGALEYAVLAPATAVSAVVLVARGADVQGGLTWPWILAVPIGFGAAVWAVRHRDLLRGDSWWRSWLRTTLDALVTIGDYRREPLARALATGGMALYWAGDIFLLWAVLHAYLGEAPSLPVLIVGYATGYALTRRTLPLAGAGIVDFFMPFALSWVSIPLASAVAAVIAYRVFNLWLPLAPAVLAWRRIVAD